MKKAYLPVFIVTSIAFAACEKDNGFASVLKAYSDSMGVLKFNYSDKNVSNISTLTGTKYIFFEHKENYVKAIFEDSQAEYFLNSSKLPMRIVYSYQGVNAYEVKYYYKNGTNILDSVINNGRAIIGMIDKYTFVYNGENIEKVIIRTHYSNTTAISESYISYTYSSVPNVFRKSDPLLFIYTNPLASFDYHSLLFHFPKTFSASTFASFSHPDYGGPRVGTLKYSTNSDGKVLKESYENRAHSHAYLYSR